MVTFQILNKKLKLLTELFGLLNSFTGISSKSRASVILLAAFDYFILKLINLFKNPSSSPKKFIFHKLNFIYQNIYLNYAQSI